MAASTLCRRLQRCHTCLLRGATESPYFKPHSFQLGSPFSVSCTLQNDPNKPRKSGDPGPLKNFRKKVAKRENKEYSGVLNSLLEGMKMIEEDGKPSAPLDSVLHSHSESQDATTKETSQAEEAHLRDVLTNLKMDTGNEMLFRRKATGSNEIDSGTRYLSLKGGRVQFTSGPRLGWFTTPVSTNTQAPPQKMTLAEEDEQKKLRALLLMKPKSYYEELLDGTSTRYPRQFPIDNEDYDQGEEAEVGFEDHVLLDHYLKGFPTKGPVRHFMELVVTGLSNNPHYTAAEKREYVQWYKDYFSQFTDKELQGLL